jgi:hypothetical protein
MGIDVWLYLVLFASGPDDMIGKVIERHLHRHPRLTLGFSLTVSWV